MFSRDALLSLFSCHESCGLFFFLQTGYFKDPCVPAVPILRSAQECSVCVALPQPHKKKEKKMWADPGIDHSEVGWSWLARGAGVGFDRTARTAWLLFIQFEKHGKEVVIAD